jgi:hypothetical protein
MEAQVKRQIQNPQLGAVNSAGCKIDGKLTCDYLRSLESKILKFVSILVVVIHN